MDSKEGIEEVAPVDAQVVGLLDPSLSRSGIEDATTANPSRKEGGLVGSPTALEGNPSRESYCLYVYVLRVSDVVLEQSIIITYNSTRSLVTGYSPYYLMFGRRSQLPIDLLFPTCRTQMLTRTIDEYVASLYDRLSKSLVIVQDCAVKEAQRQKRLYDCKLGAVELRPGDNILV